MGGGALRGGELAAGTFQSIPEEARITSSPSHYSSPPIIITNVPASCIQERNYFSVHLLFCREIVFLCILNLSAVFKHLKEKKRI